MEPLFAKGIDEISSYVGLSPQSKSLLEEVDEAADELLLPELEHYLARKYDEQIPLILKKHNLLGIPVRSEYGGLGADALTYALAMERLGQVGMGVITFVDVHSSLASLTIQDWGNRGQIDSYLKPAVRGEKVLAYALTEPEVGSDPVSLRTTFEETQDEYLLTGSKYLISNGSVADALIVFAYPKGKTEGMTAFIVDADSAGFTVSMKLEEKVGLFTSDTALLEFSNCRVPKTNVLATVGKGLHVAYSALVNGRLGISSGCVGVLEDCLNLTVERGRTRSQHGKLIGKHQLIQRHIAHIAMNLEMARWPTYMAAMKKDEFDRDKKNEELRRELDYRSALAKKIASRLACEGADHAVQVFGGFGYSLLSNPGRHFVDTRVTRIYEGTDEIMELKIASSVLGKEFEAYK